jgi:hypothetical protein
MIIACPNVVTPKSELFQRHIHGDKNLTPQRGAILKPPK